MSQAVWPVASLNEWYAWAIFVRATFAAVTAVL